MSRFAHRIRPYVDIEVSAAQQAQEAGKPAEAFNHLERAHILGQASTVEHVRVHWLMFLWGVRQKDLRECLGQVMRIIGALTKTALGWIPEGNTGGSNISPFKPLPIRADLAEKIDQARRGR